MNMNEWERVTESTYRMKVPKGWLVKTIQFVEDLSGNWQQVAVALCFVEDLDQEWTV